MELEKHNDSQLLAWCIGALRTSDKLLQTQENLGIKNDLGQETVQRILIN